MDDSARKKLLGLVYLFAGILAVVGFHDVGRQYRQYRFEYISIFGIPTSELSFYAWYFAFGLLATLFFSLFYASFFSGERLENGLKRIFSGRYFIAVGLCLLAVETLAFQRWVLQYAQVADDEAAYSFIARTLLQGRLVNPPPGDNAFFTNQFVVLTRDAWYGKYPIGHPALLALGEAVGLRFLVVPALNCLTLLLTYRVGRRLFSGQEAPLAVLLLLLSPHFVFMGASELSQPAAALCMMAGLLALLVLHEDDRLRWSLAAGACFGAGLLVRPLPGALFLPVVAVWLWFALGRTPPTRRVQHLLAGAIPVAAWAGLMLLVNSLQTGAAMRSGYHEIHRDGFLLFNTESAAMSASLVGGLLRENFWLFGWPLSLIFVPFARAGSRMALVWGLIGAVLAYRVVSPKTVVATLGPVYLTEFLPLLALATASGIKAARGLLDRLAAGAGTRLVAGFVVASTLTAGLCFLPVVLRNIHRSAESRQRVFRLIAEKTTGKVLVFANTQVDIAQRDSWAYYPPNPSPDLQDPVIFVRMSPAAVQNLDFWKRRFPDRTAWVFRPELENPDAAFVQVRTALDFMSLPAR